MNQHIQNMMAFEQLTAGIELPIFWLDCDQIIRAVNRSGLKFLSLNQSQVIGNDLAHLIHPETTDFFSNNQKIFDQSGGIVFQNELFHKQKKYFYTYRIPIIDTKNKTSALLFCVVNETCIDDARKNILQKIAQAVHDIHSPLSGLYAIIHMLSVPEAQKESLMQMLNNIRDIIDQLMHQEIKSSKKEEESYDAILISTILDQIITHKKYEFYHRLIQWDYSVEEKCYFSFIHIELSAFKRMMSNLINYCVDLLDYQEGEISVRLASDEEHVRITLYDTGINKNHAHNFNCFYSNETPNVHNERFTQIRDTLKKYHGRIECQNVDSAGMRLSVVFKKAHTPPWIAERIVLDQDTQVAILNQDLSEAWSVRFSEKKLIFPVRLFLVASEFLVYIQSLNSKKTLIIIDDSCLKNAENIFTIMGQLHFDQVIFITNHFDHHTIKERVLNIHAFILPKPLISEIPIVCNF